MVEFTKRGAIVVFDVPGRQQIRIPLRRYLEMVDETGDGRRLRVAILKSAGYRAAAKAAASQPSWSTTNF
jgi:hypothetical protein